MDSTAANVTRAQLMIFAAGFGKRLNPLSLHTPKPLVKIGDRPILKHILRHYQEHFVEQPAVINIHYLAEQFRDFIKQNTDYNILASFEKKILGTGKGLFFAKNLLQTEHFWLQNADILCNYNPQKMMNFHQKNKAIATLAVITTPITESMQSASMVHIDTNGVVLGFKKFNKKTYPQANLKTFCGIHCVSKKIFSLLLDSEVPASIIELYQILISRGEKIFARELKNTNWLDIGTPQNLDFARNNIKNFFNYDKDNK